MPLKTSDEKQDLILKELNTIASNHNSFKKKLLYDKV
jgi:hypothetical protein